MSHAMFESKYILMLHKVLKRWWRRHSFRPLWGISSIYAFCYDTSCCINIICALHFKECNWKWWQIYRHINNDKQLENDMCGLPESLQFFSSDETVTVSIIQTNEWDLIISSSTKSYLCQDHLKILMQRNTQSMFSLDSENLWMAAALHIQWFTSEHHVINFPFLFPRPFLYLAKKISLHKRTKKVSKRNHLNAMNSSAQTMDLMATNSVSNERATSWLNTNLVLYSRYWWFENWFTLFIWLAGSSKRAHSSACETSYLTYGIKSVE